MAVKKHLYRRYTSLPVLIDMLVNKRMTIVGYDTWVDANDRYSMDLYKAGDETIGFLGAYCVAKSTGQTFHQWKVFADGQSGVCITFDGAKFEKFCQSLDANKYMCGDVKYVRYKLSALAQEKEFSRVFSSDDRGNLPFVKRTGFMAEDEFRIVYSSNDRDEKVHHIAIDAGMIEEIVLSPFLSDGLLDSLKSTLKSIEGCPKRVTKARLIDSKAWKLKLDRYAAKVSGVNNA